MRVMEDKNVLKRFERHRQESVNWINLVAYVTIVEQKHFTKQRGLKPKWFLYVERSLKAARHE